MPQLVRGGGIAARESEKARRGYLLGVAAGSSVLGQNVAGDLLAKELIVRFVGVERVDNVIAIQSRFRDGIVGVVAGRVGVAGDVHPVTAPAFTVLRRREQAVDHLFECVG